MIGFSLCKVFIWFSFICLQTFKHYTDTLSKTTSTDTAIGGRQPHTLRSSKRMAQISNKDARMARTLELAPWIAIVATTLPAPILFVILFLTAAATETAFIYLLMAGLSLAGGFALGLLIAAILLLYRKRWI